MQGRTVTIKWMIWILDICERRCDRSRSISFFLSLSCHTLAYMITHNTHAYFDSQIIANSGLSLLYAIVFCGVSYNYSFGFLIDSKRNTCGRELKKNGNVDYRKWNKSALRPGLCQLSISSQLRGSAVKLDNCLVVGQWSHRDMFD